MSKELEALECIVVDLTPIAKEHNKEEIEQLKKSLQALEIIKNKEVNVSDFIYACKCSQKELKEYHDCDSNYELACKCVGFKKEKLTQEEYDLLKEALL